MVPCIECQTSHNVLVNDVVNQLVDLCHRIGQPSLQLAILAEGNISMADGNGNLWIKASGESMGSISEGGLCQVKIDCVVRAMDSEIETSADVRKALNDCQVSKSIGVPSTETYMHASLMAQTGCKVVIHTHPSEMLKFLCLADADQFARRRMFPDEIVLCGLAACYVPYVAPGLPLARSIREKVDHYHQQFGIWPKTIWLQNHGLISIGGTPAEAEATTLMSAKCGAILAGLLQTKAEIRWMTKSEIDAIWDWPDEHYRQAKINQ